MPNVMHSTKLSDVVGGLADTLRGNRQVAQDREEQQAQQRAQYFVKHATDTKLPQAQWSEWRQALTVKDPTAAKYIPDIGGMPPNQYAAAMEALEVLRRSVETKQLKD